MRRAARLLAFLAALLSLAALTVPAASAVEGQPGLGIRLLDAPVDRRDDPRAQVYVVDHLAPGGTITRRVEVVNGTDQPLTARVYAGAAQVVEGTFSGLPAGAPGELVDWTTLDRSSVTLAPRARAVVKVVVAVPDDASPGERYGAVWAELPPAGSGVAQVNRVGVRLYVSVGEGGEPASDFTVESLQASRRDDGRPVVTAQVRNTGGRALDMRGELRLTDGPGGLSAGPFPATVGTTLGIGATAPVEVVLDKAIDGGPWLATITMRSGLLVRRAEARITFPDEVGVRAQVVTAEELPLAEDPNVLIPVAGALIGLIGLLLLLLLLRRRTPDREEQPAQ